MSTVPAVRIKKANQAAISRRGDYVLYWMISSRRLHYNFALDRALEHCAALNQPLLIFEALRIDYPWASDRLHRFVTDGMAENACYCQQRGVGYFAYIEPRPGAGKGLLAALAENASVVVTDNFPCFFLPQMVASAAKKLPVLLESVDSNGMLPIYVPGQVATRAFDFRRLLQTELPKHLGDRPHPDPLRNAKPIRTRLLSEKVTFNWPMASEALLKGEPGSLNGLPLDHSVRAAPLRGGHSSARSSLLHFLDHKLPHYSDERNEPDSDVASGLSPFLHFGHLSVHEVFAELVQRENWQPEKLALGANGNRRGWWNMSPNAESFLDELITWRELGYNFSAYRADYDKYQSLPDWVQKTFKEHTADEREHLYTLEEFASGKTHDPLWNAAQIQLVRDGRIHNYLRMLWGKKILEWTRTPEEALKIMIHLNNKYALDGRNPNSYSGIFWVLGRYDRPWAPIRPIFGSVRYMSSKNTARKVSIQNYLSKYCPEAAPQKQLSFGAPPLAEPSSTLNLGVPSVAPARKCDE